VGTKINIRNYNSNGQSSERFSSAKLSYSGVALKRCRPIRTRFTMMTMIYNGHIGLRGLMSKLYKYYKILSEIFITTNFRENLHFA